MTDIDAVTFRLFKREPRAQQSGSNATIKELVCFSQLNAPAFEEGDVADELGDTEGMIAATKIVAER